MRNQDCHLCHVVRNTDIGRVVGKIKSDRKIENFKKFTCPDSLLKVDVYLYPIFNSLKNLKNINTDKHVKNTTQNADSDFQNSPVRKPSFHMEPAINVVILRKIARYWKKYLTVQKAKTSPYVYIKLYLTLNESLTWFARLTKTQH